MSEEERNIKIISVDKNAIKESPDHKEIWVLPFKLSRKPDESWERNFYDVYRKNPSEVKRKVNVAEDSILISIAATDDLQKVLDALKIDVVKTNTICEVNFQKKLQLQQELEALKKKQLEIMTKFKDDSDHLQF